MLSAKLFLDFLRRLSGARVCGYQVIDGLFGIDDGSPVFVYHFSDFLVPVSLFQRRPAKEVPRGDCFLYSGCAQYVVNAYLFDGAYGAKYPVRKIAGTVNTRKGHVAARRRGVGAARKYFQCSHGFNEKTNAMNTDKTMIKIAAMMKLDMRLTRKAGASSLYRRERYSFRVSYQRWEMGVFIAVFIISLFSYFAIQRI
jgi:hypothetical protein